MIKCASRLIKLISVLVLGLALGLTCVTCATVAFAPASLAQERHGGWNRGGGGGHGGGGWSRGGDRGWHSDRSYRYDPSAAIGGAVGGWLWRQFNDPQVIVVPQQGMTVQDCLQRYRSYNPDTRTYLGFDGQFHACP